ncbi:LPS assembly protein LptD [bacterium endosymbiont of Pedicinus badii]|uniref:LPS assembly protein LptD n=1 Tax=bacterium endosymbiont of Pedicinus badii TaxID=1719126 RepID=UPI0009BB0B16|nr:LPS assembly protein LptD [bacterium endosymbiont of Pedicinus badii]OQM34210.1 hypothetical protein AOQ89_02660 [bacterium endosymbiont of Pedicinus badii]
MEKKSEQFLKFVNNVHIKFIKIFSLSNKKILFYFLSFIIFFNFQSIQSFGINENKKVDYVNHKTKLEEKNKKIEVYGKNLTFDSFNENLKILDVDYKINDIFNGKASSLEYKKDLIVLNNCQFTSCESLEDTWKISGKKVIYDDKEKSIKIWNAVFKVKNTPVFYSPYVKILDRKEKKFSSFLFPIIKFSNKNGFELGVPYYFSFSDTQNFSGYLNFSKNYGTYFKGSFNYLAKPEIGKIEIFWFPTNKSIITDEEDKEYGMDQHLLLRLKQKNSFENWKFDINYTIANYKNFIGNPYFISNYQNNYAEKKIRIDYSDEYSDFTILTQKFQPLDSKDKRIFTSIIPKIDYKYTFNIRNFFDLETNFQYSNFKHPKSKKVKNTRFYIEPKLILPLYKKNWANISTELSMQNYFYSLEDVPLSKYNQKILHNSYYENVKQIKTIGKLSLENQINEKYTQFIEPKIQYLKTSNNNRYLSEEDAKWIYTDYFSLYRDKQESGKNIPNLLDQVVFGVQTSIYDKNLKEVLNASLGKIFMLIGDTYSKSNQRNFQEHLFAGNMFVKLNKVMNFKSILAYDSKRNKTLHNENALEFHKKSDFLFQIRHQYNNREYIENMFFNQYSSRMQYISQIGLSTVLPVYKNIYLNSSNFFNVKNKKLIRHILGIKYKNRCLDAGLGFEKKMIIKNDNKMDYEKNITINFELLGNKKNSREEKEMYFNKDAFLTYQEVF